MNYINAPPTPNSPGIASMPNGWKAEWSAEHARYFYVNLHTRETTWVLPALPEPQQVQQSIQRKLVPNQTSQAPTQLSAPVTQTTFGYPTPPTQTTTGYFPTATGTQQQFQQQQYSYQAPVPVQQQYPPAYTQQPQHNQYVAPGQVQPNSQQQYPTATQQIAQQTYSTPYTPGARQSPAMAASSVYQGQQNNYPPPNSGLSTNQALPAMSSPQYSQPTQPQQTFSPPPQPGNCSTPQLPQVSPTPNYQPAYTPGPPVSNRDIPQQPQVYNPYLQPSNIPGQGPMQCQQNSQSNQMQPSHQQQTPQTQYQPQQPYIQEPKPNRSSMIGGGLMGGNMMNKMSSKFTQLQSRAVGPQSTAPAHGKPATDWKKWGKRAAIGVAGIGALALGVDAAGDMFSGAAGLEAAAGGGDFSGTGFEGMDAQTAVDANAAQLAMEQTGQNNAMMLLDPVGTEYVVVNDTSPAGLI